MSLPGLSRIGLNRTLGASPAARACIAWARPISPPSTVTAELFDMFCALNGATRTPLRASSRHSPATTIDLPASDVVPATSRAPLTAGLSRKGENFRAGIGDQQGVLELGGPLAVSGDDGPIVVPYLVVQRAEVDHRLDRESHPRLEDGGDGRLVVVQHNQPVVKCGADTVAGEVANDVVAEPVCIRFDDPADNREGTPRFDGFDRPHGGLVRPLHQQTVFLGDVTGQERGIGVAVNTVDVGREV